MFNLDRLKSLLTIFYFKSEYALEAYIAFAVQKLKGSNYLKRTQNRPDIEYLKRKIEQNRISRTVK